MRVAFTLAVQKLGEHSTKHKKVENSRKSAAFGANPPGTRNPGGRAMCAGATHQPARTVARSSSTRRLPYPPSPPSHPRLHCLFFSLVLPPLPFCPPSLPWSPSLSVAGPTRNQQQHSHPATECPQPVTAPRSDQLSSLGLHSRRRIYKDVDHVGIQVQTLYAEWTLSTFQHNSRRKVYTASRYAVGVEFSDCGGCCFLLLFGLPSDECCFFWWLRVTDTV